FPGSNPDNPTISPSVHRRARVLDYGGFLQDSWKATPGLTINVGLRWGGESTRNYAGQTGLRLKDQWQPRGGVVWDPWSDGKTKIYASAGRFSYAIPTAAAAMVFANYPGYLYTYNFDPVSVLQDPNVLHHEEAFVAKIPGPSGDPVDGGLR